MESTRPNIAGIIISLGIIGTLIFVGILSSNRAQIERLMMRFTNTHERIAFTVPRNEQARDLALHSVQFQQGSTSIHDVRVSVENISDEAQDGVVWFIISQDTLDEPWERAYYVSEQINFSQLAPDDRFETLFPAITQNFEPDQYRISFWVHTRADDGSNHADGFTYWEGFWLRESLLFELNDVHLTTDEESTNTRVELTLSITNQSEQAQTLAISYTIADPTNEHPWEDDFFIAPLERVNLLAGEVFTTSYSEHLTLPDGRYRLTASLYRIEGDQQTEIDRIAWTEDVNIP
ncbi:MAG: hypothetical protein ACFE0Q_19330 [Anaerolineae bacterium]